MNFTVILFFSGLARQKVLHQSIHSLGYRQFLMPILERVVVKVLEESIFSSCHLCKVLIAC